MSAIFCIPCCREAQWYSRFSTLWSAAASTAYPKSTSATGGPAPMLSIHSCNIILYIIASMVSSPHVVVHMQSEHVLPAGPASRSYLSLQLSWLASHHPAAMRALLRESMKYTSHAATESL